MKRRLLFLFIFLLQITFVKAQDYVHQVFVLNEGYFDYNSNQSIIPPTIGSYNPSTQTYISVDTLNVARFASDIVVDQAHFYVAADNMLYKYDKNNYNLIHSQSIDGIRNIAIWNDKIIVTRGDYDNITFSPILFDSYLQAYNTSDLSLYSELDTVLGPKWATQNLVIDGDILYVAINNAYEWGNEKGLIGIVDLNTFSYLDEIDLGPDGINPDNMMKSGDHIYTINNKDWSGASISRLSMLTNSVSTTNLAGSPTGCGTSCLRDNKINYQISGDSILNEWDLSLLSNTGIPLPINQNFYDLSHDPINNFLYASITDYTSSGSVNIYDSNNSLLFSFICGVSPGTIFFDIRNMNNTSITEDLLGVSDLVNPLYDILGRPIIHNRPVSEGVYITNGKQIVISK